MTPKGKGTFIKFLILGLLVAGMAFPAAPGWADNGVKLTFQEHILTVKQGKKGEQPKKEETDNVLTVTLWPSLLSVDDGKKNTVFDFNNRKIDILDAAHKTYEENSLYYEIGYRGAEFHNRLFMQEALKAAGDITPEFRTFQLETLFGLKNPEKKTPDALVKKTGPSSWNFNAPEGDLVAQAQSGEAKVPLTLADSWRHFLIYGCSLHPSIMDFLVRDGRFPKSLTFQRLNVGESRRVTLTLEKQEEAPAPDGAWRKSYRLTKDTDPELWALVEKASASRPPEAAETKNETVAFVEKASKQGHAFDAALACIECSLQTGLKMDETLRLLVSQLKDDPNMQAFQVGLNTRSPQEAEEAIKALQSIDRKGLTKGYVIDIMLGDAYEADNKPKEAIESYFKALRANPLLAGPWKDLGDVYYDGYDMDLAWLCWDTGRRLYPNHPILEGVTEQESSLVKACPEYF